MKTNENWKKKLDDNGKPLIVDNDFVMELVSSEIVEDEILTKEQKNKMCFNELSLTDWYFTRKVELGIEVPNEIIKERLDIRNKYK